MAFVCTAGDFPPQLVNGSVVIPVGYDDENPIDYSVLMGFEPMAGGDPEFFWVILGTNREDGSVTEYWSGLETEQLIHRPARTAIRLAVLDGVAVLLSSNKPERVFCCTHDSNAPEKALYKHVLVAAMFKTCGYEALRQPVQLGKHSWWMELKK